MSKILYGKAVYDSKEINASLNVLKTKSISLIDGPSVKDLEKNIQSVWQKIRINGKLRFISKLISVSITKFKKGYRSHNTYVNFFDYCCSIFQLGLIPHFIDVDNNTFTANISQIINAINKKTSAIMIPNLIGNVPDWKKIFKIAKKYKLKVIEDSADTIGYSIKGKKLWKIF